MTIKLPDLRDDDFQFFQDHVLKLCGIHLTAAKGQLLQTRLFSRLQELGLTTLASYKRHIVSLPKDHPEWQLFVNLMTTNKTNFFREEAHFEYLTRHFLPEWARRNPHRKLRVWSAACSSGEEPYTLAMLLEEFFGGQDRYEIVGSDVDTEILRTAVNGVYGRQKVEEIPDRYRRFVAMGTGAIRDWFKIRKGLQSRVKFVHRNLVEMPYDDMGSFDVIFCRNVFIYFKYELIEQIVECYHRACAPGGLLFVGHSETLSNLKSQWEAVEPAVYCKKTSPFGQSAASTVPRPEPRSEEPPSIRSRPAPEVPARKQRVLIVDDSATMRKLLSTIIGSSPKLEVVAAIGDPLETEAAIKKYRPDVMTLDIHMPHLDGCQVLERILPHHPLPTLMISALGMEEGGKVLRALELGAVDYVQKPELKEMDRVAPLIIEKILMAAGAKVKLSKTSSASPRRLAKPSKGQAGCELIAIGSSTGGPEALRAVLTRLPAELPPIVIVQHIPPVFSKALAQRLNGLCELTVKEAEPDEVIKAGHVYLAPGGTQMRLEKKGRSYRLEISDGAPVNRHKPSVDVLFDSVAAHIGAKAIGVILTGMGEDGARGLLKMKQSGARTVAQDEFSSVVYGMPKEAARLGAADKQLPLGDIAGALISWLETR